MGQITEMAAGKEAKTNMFKHHLRMDKCPLKIEYVLKTY